MNADRWKQVEEAYHAALEKEPSERPAFLSEFCGDDVELRAEVESLISHDDAANDFIETRALDVAARELAAGSGPAIVPGQTVKHYRVKSALGSGGMGEVYLADDTRLGRKVALKLLPAHLVEDKSHLRRFQQEARVIASLSHPNVCAIYDLAETENGQYCIVMEHVDGGTLRERIARGRIPIEEALELGIQITSAASAAHKAGVVHRDIKPENIMVRPDGYVKVLDFGLAKLSDASTTPQDIAQNSSTGVKTLPGIVLGTAAYMSPEQARGLSVDARTDIWSIGAILYEMISGQQPFAGTTPMDVIISVVERDPRGLSALVDTIPVEMETIVERALAKDPEKRYQDADNMLTDLKALRHRLTVESGLDRYHSSNTATDAALNGRGVAVAKVNRVVAIAAISGFAILAALAAAWYIPYGPTTVPGGKEIKSLAVLPLENLSGDSSQEYFAAGMTDVLITDLSKIRSLRVISRPTVMQYNGTQKTLSDIGRELNVDSLVTGSVARDGDRVRISVELIYAPTLKSLWTNSYERDIREVLSLQSEVTRDIAAHIRINLTPKEREEIRKAAPVDPVAYDYYLRGTFNLHRHTKEDNAAAIAAFENAVSVDPGFAAAHAELAQAYVWKLFLYSPEEKRLAESAYVETEKALALDPDLAVAYLARGRLLWTPDNHFPHERAIREYRRALDLDPNLDEARNQLALVYSHIGALDEALHEVQRAVVTNPSNSQAQFRIGEVLLFQGKFEDAVNALRGVPSDVNPALVGDMIVWALWNMGRKEDASATLKQYLLKYPEDDRGLFTSIEAVMEATASNHAEAEKKIRLAFEKGQGFGHFHHTEFQIACAYARMNQGEKAIRSLESAAEKGFPCFPLFEKDPNLESVRRDPRFTALIDRLRKQLEQFRTAAGINPL